MSSYKHQLTVLLISMLLAGEIPLTFAGSSHDYYCSTRVVGYYPDYHTSKLPISQIRFDKLTHIIYFSISPGADGSLDAGTVDLSRQQQLVAAAHEQNVKVFICVGGWGLCNGFSAMAANQSTRAIFITNIVRFCCDNSLDGVDLDWEPLTNITDKNNYATLIRELKTALIPYNLKLTAAVSAMGTEFNDSAIAYIDWLHVMAYDMGTPHSSYSDSILALEHWKTFGFDSKKIVLGVPFYGRRSDSSYCAYSYIINTYHPTADVDEVNGINFNGITTIKRKTQYVVQNDYGGIAIWEIPEDTTDNTSLLTSAADRLHCELPPDFNCDGAVDSVDLRDFAAYFLDAACSSENAWCDNTDRNLSGTIELADFALFAGQWLE